MSYIPMHVLLPSGIFTRTLFYRQHSVRKSDDASAANTLFVTNLPPACTADFLTAAFSKFGDVAEIEFGSVERDGSSVEFARVQMANAKGVHRAVAAADTEPIEVPDSMPKEAMGTKKWEAQFRASRPPVAALEASVGKALVDFDSREEAERLEREAQGEVVDEDGFTLVTRRGSKRFAGAGGSSMPVATNDGPAKKKKKKAGETIDFYRFQQRQRRREEIAQLRQRFDKDKLRIAKQRAMRTFKPF